MPSVSLTDLKGLERVWSLALTALPAGRITLATTPDGAYAALRTEWEPIPRVVLVDLQRGEVARVIEPFATLGFFPARGVLLAQDKGFRARDRKVASRIVDLLHPAHAHAVADDVQLLSVAPMGDELLVFTRGGIRILSWPDLRTRRELPGFGPSIDWDAKVIALSNPPGQVAIVSWAAEPIGTLAIGVPTRSGANMLGHGLVQLGYAGLSVASARYGFSHSYLPARRKEHTELSVDATGTRLRFTLGGKPRVIEIDPVTGHAIRKPPDTEHLLRKGGALFHPTLDVAVYSKSRAQPSVDLRRAEEGQPIVFRLGKNVEPLAWTCDGTTLLVARGQGEQRMLEAWSIRSKRDSQAHPSSAA